MVLLQTLRPNLATYNGKEEIRSALEMSNIREEEWTEEWTEEENDKGIVVGICFCHCFCFV